MLRLRAATSLATAARRSPAKARRSLPEIASRKMPHAYAISRSLLLLLATQHTLAIFKNSSPSFSVTCELFFRQQIPNPLVFNRLRTLSSSAKEQPPHFQSLPNSLHALLQEFNIQPLCFQPRAACFVKSGGGAEIRSAPGQSKIGTIVTTTVICLLAEPLKRREIARFIRRHTRPLALPHQPDLVYKLCQPQQSSESMAGYGMLG
jgi:hypothetical protein